MTFKTTAFIMAALGVGTGAGWMLHDSNENASPQLVGEQRFMAPTTRALVASTPAIDIDQLRQVVREELLAAQTNGSTRPDTLTAPKSTPVSPELAAKRQAAVDEVETMIRSGEWGNEQRATFHQHMAMLDHEQAARLLREVTIAFNQGTMRITTDGPPL
jgi:hypothetical protein